MPGPQRRKKPTGRRMQRRPRIMANAVPRLSDLGRTLAGPGGAAQPVSPAMAIFGKVGETLTGYNPINKQRAIKKRMSKSRRPKRTTRRVPSMVAGYAAKKRVKRR